ncbi:MAG TPA: lanthionine synthetase LanC family protein [Longimicrobium sp.]|nr:lanthionine synthetase LanC family protein [Longimicrobium sp.]
MSAVEAPADAGIEAAARIGARLCGTAVWDRDRRHCNWMGRTDGDEGPPQPGARPTAAALAPHLYGGSSGVALFLAELYGATGDPRARETAVGALRRSARHLRRTKVPASPLSFFSAHLGVAYVAARILELDPEAGLDRELEETAAAALRAVGEPHPLDLLNGAAGAIPVFLHLARRGVRGCAEATVRLADELCAAAMRSGGACAWDAVAMGGLPSPPLTGLSHGASGVAVGLLEAYHETGTPAYLETACGALAYEDTCFAPARGNWLDMRRPHTLTPPDGVCQAAWCHGAPGIGLARLRARALDPERADVHAAAARVALAATLRALENSLATTGHDATLCHGTAGLSEVVLCHAQALGDEQLHATALSAAAELERRHGKLGDWPAAVAGGGPVPGLMVGEAGIGHHFLRVHDPAGVPPILLLASSGSSSGAGSPTPVIAPPSRQRAG